MSRRLLCALLAAVSTFAQDAVGQQGVNRESPPAVTWDSLEKRLKWESQRGFSGVVLMARQGQVVFHQAYGMANREKKIAMRPDTILAVGSTPIDWTKAAVLLLVEQGKLDYEAPIGRYVPNVPGDKQTITIEHLMTGRSGLPDFFDLPTDRDPDHAWIDRDEALRRILSLPVQFAPGTERRHSHAAFGLLAVIVELASGQSYQEFTAQHLFRPAGMRDTGFFGAAIPESRLAVGYGPKKDGEVNAPPYWGPTSWLVMGSGGQTSTAEDMWRWTQALRGGKLLSVESLLKFGPGDGILDGGDMYGFQIMYAGNAENFMVLLSNARNPRTARAIERLAEDLARLVLPERPRFTLGIGLEPLDDGDARISEVIPGGPAERAGIQSGDVLRKIGGQAVTGNLMEVLFAALRDGKPVELTIERSGAERVIRVQPVER